MRFSPLLPDGEPGHFHRHLHRNGDSIRADIHDRMPVWLTAGEADDWLAADPDDALAMLLASIPPAMEAYRVSRALNTPGNNQPALLDQVA